MKTIIATLCIIGYTFAAQGTPAASSYCQGNVEGATTCSSCLNTGTNAKQFATNACTTNIANTITDCLWYNPTITATKSIQDCYKCNSKTWMNVTANAVAASIIVACSNTAIDATACAAVVANCDVSFCYKNTSNTYSKGCRMCASGYKTNGTPSASGLGATGCVANTVTNCTYGSIASTTNCDQCASGYAVAYAGTSCVAFTVDSNCRKLATGDTYCGYCNNGYYFSTTTCTSAANMMALSGLIMAALFFFN